MVEEASNQRLLRHIQANEPVHDQTHVLLVAEERVYTITKSWTPKQVREDGAALLRQIKETWAPFDCRLRPVFLDLWTFLLCDTPGIPVKDHLDTICEVAKNNQLKRLVSRDIRTSSKHKGLVRRILNLHEETFNSLFADVDLTEAEAIQRDNLKVVYDAARAALEAFLTEISFERDENVLIQTFYQYVDVLPNPVERNKYLNRLLVPLVRVLMPPRVAMAARAARAARAAVEERPLPLLNLLVQLVDHVLHKEMIKTLDPAVEAYLTEYPVPFLTHSLHRMPMVLEPHSNFKAQRLSLDPAQRGCLRAIGRKENVLLCAPTSWGKTWMSTGVLNENEDVWYVAPEKPLAQQMACLVTASLVDRELLSTTTKNRNVRLELNLPEDWTSEAKAEAVPTYRRFPSRPDNVVVAQPQRLYELLHAGKAPKKPQYVILDEFHNVRGPQGAYYEYILKWAAYQGVNVMAMTATIPAEQIPTVHGWMEGLLGSVYLVNESRRFFHPRRIVFRVDSESKRVSMSTLNALDHLPLEILRSPTFRHPGLFPTEVLRLYRKVPSFPRIDESVRKMPSLDDVDHLEESLFRHVQSLSDEEVAGVVRNESVESDKLSIDQIHAIQCSLSEEFKPLLQFKMESLPCLRYFLQRIHHIQAKNKVVYGNFQDDQPILQKYLNDVADLMKGDEDGSEGASEEAQKKSEALRKQREALYMSKCLPALQDFYKRYTNPPDDAAGRAVLEAAFGCAVTQAEIVATRQALAAKQLAQTYDGVRLRTEYTIHNDLKVAKLSGSIMKDLRGRINAELAYQRKATGPLQSLRAYGEEFAEFDDIQETRHWKRFDARERKWVRTGESETRKVGLAWASKRPDGDGEVDYTYEISYEHPWMVGAECGLFLYNELLNPAFGRIAQLLLGKHPIILITTKAFAVGANYGVRASWIQGALKGEPDEEVDNTLANQAWGRAGRRGFDKHAVYIGSGIQMKSVLFPQFHPVGRNDPTLLEPLLEGEDAAFRTFVLTETRPVPAATATVAVAVAANVVVYNAATPAAATPSLGAETVAEAAKAAKLAAFLEFLEKGGNWEEWED